MYRRKQFGTMTRLALMLAYATLSLSALLGEVYPPPAIQLSDDQRLALEALRSSRPGSLEISWDESISTPRFISGYLTDPSSQSPSTIAARFLSQIQDLFQITADQELVQLSPRTDEVGMIHIDTKQVYNDVEVYGGGLSVHITSDGVITAVNGRVLPGISLSAQPTISSQQSQDIAIQDLGDSAAVPAPPELFFFNPGWALQTAREDHLVWRLVVTSEVVPGVWVYFIDALSGNVVFKYNDLKDARNRVVYGFIIGGCNYGAVLYGENGPLVGNPPAEARDEYNFSGDVYNYYSATHRRDSYDNRGAVMRSVTDWPACNAQWDPVCQRTMFGRGFVKKDVVGHEWTHAVTEHTANLFYHCEAGALNESMSDVFGSMIKRTDWLIGDGITVCGQPRRDMANPPAYGQPDRIDGIYDPCAEVHINSGIPNKVAYLISEGGMHYGVQVQGIGRNDTEKIYYRALTVILFHKPFSQFPDARNALIQAARDLFGEPSRHVCAVKNAWVSVGVGTDRCAPQPNADFTVIVNPGQLELPQGQSANATITLQRLNGFNSAVSLSVQGLPSGVTSSLSPQQIPGPSAQTSTLTLSARADAPLVSGREIRLRAQQVGPCAGTCLTREFTMRLTVGQLERRITLLLDNSDLEARIAIPRGRDGRVMVHVNRLNYTGNIYLGLSATTPVESGVTIDFVPSVLLGPSQTDGKATISTSCNTPIRSYALAIYAGENSPPSAGLLSVRTLYLSIVQGQCSLAVDPAQTTLPDTVRTDTLLMSLTLTGTTFLSEQDADQNLRLVELPNQSGTVVYVSIPLEPSNGQARGTRLSADRRTYYYLNTNINWNAILGQYTFAYNGARATFTIQNCSDFHLEVDPNTLHIPRVGESPADENLTFRLLCGTFNTAGGGDDLKLVSVPTETDTLEVQYRLGDYNQYAGQRHPNGDLHTYMYLRREAVYPTATAGAYQFEYRDRDARTARRATLTLRRQ